MDWKYIAGFFDGEGTVAHNGKGFRITIPQTDEGVLKKIQEFVGFGYIIKLKKRKAHWKDSWLYYIASQKEVYIFLKKIKPYLIVKSKVTQKAMDYLPGAILNMKKKKKLYEKRKLRARQLRLRGLSYRQIGKKLDIDWGYARRMALDLI